MNTLRAALAAVKENAMHANPHPEDEYRIAARDLLTRGDYTANGVTYSLIRFSQGGYETWDGHRLSNQGNAYHRGNTVEDVVRWLLKPIAAVVVWTDEWRRVAELTHKSTCPFGCGDAVKQTVLTVASSDGRLMNQRQEISGCEHYLCEHRGDAAFLAYADDVETCWSCDSWTPVTEDRCLHCAALQAADPSIDAEIQGDAAREES